MNDPDKALSVNGSGYVRLPSGFANFSNGFSFEVWAYPTAASNWGSFFDLSNGIASDNIQFQRRATSPDLHLEVWHDGSSVALDAPAAISLNAWQHFVATVDASGTARLYKNGNQVASTTNVLFLPPNVSRTANYVGRDAWGDYFRGRLDEPAIYNFALTPGQVLAHYKAGLALP